MMTASELRNILSYDPTTGEFRWRRASKRLAGRTNCSTGYREIQIGRRLYGAHRLAWLYMKGEWPPFQIDHDNLQKTDNRWSNLRDATPGQNSANTPKRRSGLKGVTLHKTTGKYQAQIKTRNINFYLGLFEDEASAHAAYMKKAIELFGNFARAA